MGEWQTFLREARSNWHHTGAIAPSSRGLARAVTSRLRDRDRSRPVNIAEVGPGTGSFTRAIAREMGPEDRLRVYDINPTFLRYVEDLVTRHGDFDGVRPRVHLRELDARALDEPEGFDFLVSGLPFNNFDAALVKDILEAYLRCTRRGGIITFFEYAGARQAKKVISSARRRSELRDLGELVKGYLDRHQVQQERVLANIPPAIVHHLRR